MNYQFDYQMKNPLAWREDYVVSLSDNPVHLGGLFPAAYGIGFWADDLRARRGCLSAMKRASCRSDVPQRLHSALKHLLYGEISQSVLGSLHAMQEWQDWEEWNGSQEPRAVGSCGSWWRHWRKYWVWTVVGFGLGREGCFG